MPAPLHRWEVYTPLIVEATGRERATQLPNIDANYGAGRNLQLSLESGLLWLQPAGDHRRAGLPDTEFQIKYRFMNSGPENHRLQVAFYPQIFFPTGNHRLGLGSGRVDEQLPLVWLYELGKKARLYGDLRAGILHAAGTRNFFFGGLAFESEVAHGWTLTGEIYGHTAEESDASGTVGLNLGFIHELRGPSARDPEHSVNLLFSIGRSFGPGPDLTLYFGPGSTFR